MAFLISSSSPRRLQRILRGVLLGWLCLGVWLASLCAEAGPAPEAARAREISTEYQVKAVFLFDFAQFAEWPEAAFAGPDAPFVIGIIGEDPFGKYLDALVKGERVGHRPLLVRRFRSLEDMHGCHILFLSRSKANEFADIFAALAGQSVLTIGDTDDFNRAGGIVRFATESGKIRLKINLDAAKAAHLTISSKILRPSTLVTVDKE